MHLQEICNLRLQWETRLSTVLNRESEVRDPLRRTPQSWPTSAIRTYAIARGSPYFSVRAPRSVRFYDLHNTCVTLLQSRGFPVKVASEMLSPGDVAIALAVNRSVLPHVQESAGRRG